MNEKDKAVLDAARKYASLLHVGNGTSRDVRQATIAIQDAALAAFPADAEPPPETVRAVADLRDGETVMVWGKAWQVKVYQSGNVSLQGGHRVIGIELVPLAVAAGAVTRPARPEPDPADVERLVRVLFESDDKTISGMARALLRSGEVTLRDPS